MVMNAILKSVSFLALAATLVPAILYLTGAMDLYPVKVTALIGTLVWFATCPLWMGRDLTPDADQVEI